MVYQMCEQTCVFMVQQLCDMYVCVVQQMCDMYVCVCVCVCVCVSVCLQNLQRHPPAAAGYSRIETERQERERHRHKPDSKIEESDWQKCLLTIYS